MALVDSLEVDGVTVGVDEATAVAVAVACNVSVAAAAVSVEVAEDSNIAGVGTPEDAESNTEDVRQAIVQNSYQTFRKPATDKRPKAKQFSRDVSISSVWGPLRVAGGSDIPAWESCVLGK